LPEIKLLSMYRILKKAGGDRVSEESVKELRTTLEKIAYEISANAVDLSHHAGRKTIKSEDIQLAVKSFNLKK
jgi:DNA-binding protein